MKVRVAYTLSQVCTIYPNAKAYYERLNWTHLPYKVQKLRWSLFECSVKDGKVWNIWQFVKMVLRSLQNGSYYMLFSLTGLNLKPYNVFHCKQNWTDKLLWNLSWLILRSKCSWRCTLLLKKCQLENNIERMKKKIKQSWCSVLERRLKVEPNSDRTYAREYVLTTKYT